MQDLAGSAAGSLAKRFFLVMYLPTAVATSGILLLVWAGAPASHPSLTAARDKLLTLGAVDLVCLASLVLILALLLNPLQLTLVRWLEGRWPSAMWPVAVLLRGRQAARYRKLARQETLPDDPTREDVRKAGLAGTQLRRQFPAEQPLRPTALGNVLAAAEERAGAAYGWDAVVAWPRLYPLLPEQTRHIVDDRRNSMDLAATVSVTMALTAVGAVALLAQLGWAMALALIPIGISRLSYRGAVHAALAYGEAIQTSFDLHRFDLYLAMHLPLPLNRDEELATTAALCDFWRQGIQMDLTYQHERPGQAEPPPPGRTCASPGAGTT